MNDKLKAAYEQLAEQVPGYGEADRAVRTAQRRRTTWSIAVPAVSVVLAAGVVIGVAQLGSEQPAPAGQSPEKQLPEPTRSIDEWAPEDVNVGTPAKVGTLMYHSCVSGECRVRLVRPDGNEFDLADARPDLAERLDKQGLRGASLSYDAQWLGFPDGTGYEIHQLDAGPGAAIQLPPGPPGSRWEVVSWGESSYNVSLSQWHDGHITAYALAETVSHESGTTDLHVYEPPRNLDVLPVDNGGDSVQVAKPIDTSVPPDQRQRLTKRQLGYIVLAPNTGEPRGTFSGLGEFDDLSPWMKPGETLAGPRGVPEMSCPPTGDDIQPGLCATTVFAPHDDQLLPTAVIRGGWGEQGDRHEIPSSTDDETWSLLEPLTDHSIALAHTTADDNRVKVVEVSLDGEQEVLHELPQDAQVLLPGMTVR